MLLFLVVLAAGTGQAQQTRSALDLFTAATDAAKSNRLEDAAFLFYVGQLRYRYELALFPPDDQSGEAEALAAYRQELGEAINPAVFRDPPALRAAMRRYDAWTPEIASGFKPVWKASHPGDPKQARSQMLSTKQDFSHHMNNISTLLNDPAYFRAFAVSQDCHLKPEPSKPNPAACTSATEAMERIERSRHIEGFVTAR